MIHPVTRHPIVADHVERNYPRSTRIDEMTAEPLICFFGFVEAMGTNQSIENLTTGQRKKTLIFVQNLLHLRQQSESFSLGVVVCNIAPFALFTAGPDFCVLQFYGWPGFRSPISLPTCSLYDLRTVAIAQRPREEPEPGTANDLESLAIGGSERLEPGCRRWGYSADIFAYHGADPFASKCAKSIAKITV